MKNILFSLLIVLIMTGCNSDVNRNRKAGKQPVKGEQSEIESEHMKERKSLVDRERHGANKYDSEYDTVSLGEGLGFSVCWCYGIKILEYNKEHTWGTTNTDNFIVYQNETTRDLMIEDKGKNFLAYYSADGEFTYTITGNGTQTMRYNEFSVYYWEDGIVTVAYKDGREDVNIRTDKGYVEISDEVLGFSFGILEANKDYASSKLLANSLNLNFNPLEDKID